MRLTPTIAAGVICLAAATGGAQANWTPRGSAEFPFWTAAVRGSDVSEFFSGYGFELATEREVRPGQTIGGSVVMMRGLMPNAVACATGDGYSGCGDERGHSTGVFATFRQYLPRSRERGNLAATVGVGLYEFSGEYLGKQFLAGGPALSYGAEAMTPKLWDLSLVASVRAQLVFGVGDRPMHVTTATFGIRAR